MAYKARKYMENSYVNLTHGNKPGTPNTRTIDCDKQKIKLKLCDYAFYSILFN